MRENSRMAIGFQVAMTVLAHNKAAAGTTPVPQGALYAAMPHKSLPKLLKEKTQKLLDEEKEPEKVASAVWDVSRVLVKEGLPSTHTGEAAKPMSYEQARLWLQAYNAGPNALLRNKGTVPYKETQNYVPKVMKFYAQDLSDTPYEELIVKTAHKYGLDPQMVRAVMKTESSFNPKTVSHAGARGLMQVMPIVWKHVSQRYDDVKQWDYSSNVFEPEKNIEVACAYLAWLRYDFLPRHFVAFEQPEPIPAALVRDNAPARKSARIATTEVAQAAREEHKTALTQAKVAKPGKDVASVSGKSEGIKITSASKSKAGQASGGKTAAR